jgi:hypothetical protein
MESGWKRVRRNLDLTRQVLQVQWNFTQDQFDQFRQFFEKDLNRGVNSFQVECDGLEGIAAFHPPTYSFTYQDGVFSVTATWVLVPANYRDPLGSYILAGPLLDSDACLPPDASVRGTTFEGYSEGRYIPPTIPFPVAGRGITNILIGDAAFGHIRGTTFEKLPEGEATGIVTGVGITRVVVGEGRDINNPRLMDFEKEKEGKFTVNVNLPEGYTATFVG